MTPAGGWAFKTHFELDHAPRAHRHLNQPGAFALGHPQNLYPVGWSPAIWICARHSAQILGTILTMIISLAPDS
ncbi:hypothetical protein THIX_60478 [Thiomonas sp. X19]|nr:hypothetical protein THIX_60478 [Thiomonas sp. X19]